VDSVGENGTATGVLQQRKKISDHRMDMMVVAQLSGITLHTGSQELRGGTGLAVAACRAK
jgi:hypothetical protein